MKIIKCLFLFLAMGLLLVACSKENADPLEADVATDASYGKYSIRITFDDHGFDPEWLIDISGGTVQFEDKFDIEGLEFTSEIEEYSANKKIYNFLYESRGNKAAKKFEFKFKQKSLGVTAIMTINGVEEISPSGKAEVFKEGHLVNSFDIGDMTFIMHPYED